MAPVGKRDALPGNFLPSLVALASNEHDVFGRSLRNGVGNGLSLIHI